LKSSRAPGQGTTFRLYLPLTLAVTKALLVRSGNRQYAIPSAMIEQVLDLKEQMLARIREAKEAVWTGNHYPFSYLPHLLGETRRYRKTFPVLGPAATQRQQANRAAGRRTAGQSGNRRQEHRTPTGAGDRRRWRDGSRQWPGGADPEPDCPGQPRPHGAAVSPVPTVRQPVATDSVTATCRRS
jgi:hypothetical protein